MKIKITDYKLTYPSDKKLVFAVAADMHNRQYGEVMTQLVRLHPDFIAIPGDLMDVPEEAQTAVSFLREAVSVAPVFYSVGNHERISDTGRKLITDTGCVLLDDSYVSFEGITIGGLTSGFRTVRVNNLEKTPPPDLEWLNTFASLPGFKLLLCHHPEYYPDYIRPLAIDLTLSGHAHGGQWRLFGRGLFAPGQGILPKYTSGIHENRFIISRGLANNAFIPRIFNTPELLSVTLLPKEKQ
ncbi:MAG TPA: metallophosphoesterase [Bacillota bacterium]|nr:metallophosphoesterase [Bacillota bacterium]